VRLGSVCLSIGLRDVAKVAVFPLKWIQCYKCRYLISQNFSECNRTKDETECLKLSQAVSLTAILQKTEELPLLWWLSLVSSKSDKLLYVKNWFILFMVSMSLLFSRGGIKNEYHFIGKYMWKWPWIAIHIVHEKLFFLQEVFWRHWGVL
jgi:hypothetical protein